MFKPNELERFAMVLDTQMKALEQRIMEDVVRRIRINGEITRAADWQINRLRELGVAKSEIKKAIAESLNYSDKDMLELYKNIVSSGYERDRNTYLKAGGDIIPFEDNHSLQQLISSVAEQTSGTMQNITQTLGFAKKEGGRVKFTELSDYYQQTLDGAILDIASGSFDYNTVLKRVVGELTNSGLRTVDYASGKSFRVESAARMAIKTGMTQLTAKVNEDNARELGTDTFEVSYHGGARPSHQVWQGRVFTRAQLGTICGLGSAGGLCGPNCYHDYYPFIEGISERTYTDEELDRMNAEENKPREYNGKQYTAYEATQRQRALERTMRAQRQKIHLLKEGGADESDIINARAQYRATSAEYSRFSKAMGIPQERERVTVDGLGNIGVGKYKQSEPGSSANNTVDTKNPEIKKNVLDSSSEMKSYVKEQVNSEKPLDKSVESGIIESGIVNSELGKFKQKIINDDRMSDDYYHAIKDRFSHGSETAKAAFNKFIPTDSVEKTDYEGSAHYSPVSKKITMHYGADLNNNRGVGTTWFHEHGHMIDDMAGNLSSNEKFQELLRKDKLEYTVKLRLDRGAKSVDETYRLLEDELSDVRSQSGVADIFNGLSAGKIKGCGYHSDDYWTSENVLQEAFAHMYEAQFDEVRYGQMKKYFPSSLDYFEQILKEAVK